MPVLHFQSIDYFKNIIENRVHDEQMKKIMSIYNPFLNYVSIIKKINILICLYGFQWLYYILAKFCLFFVFIFAFVYHKYIFDILEIKNSSFQIFLFKI